MGRLHIRANIYTYTYIPGGVRTCTSISVQISSLCYLFIVVKSGAFLTAAR